MKMKTVVLLTGGGGAAVQCSEQRAEQVLLGKARPFLHHEEHRPGGHTLELPGCQLVFEVQEVKDLQTRRKLIYLLDKTNEINFKQRFKGDRPSRPK